MPLTFLGDVESKTIVGLGCGEGLNTVILAPLEAMVISVSRIADRFRLKDFQTMRRVHDVDCWLIKIPIAWTIASPLV